MKTYLIKYRFAWVALVAAMAWSIQAAPFELISERDASLNPSPGGNGDSWGPVISPDGRYVLFVSVANNLVSDNHFKPMPSPMPMRFNVYLRDRTQGTTELVSISTNGVRGADRDCLPRGMSSDGRYILFESSAGNLVTNDANNASDVFLRDRVQNKTILVSANATGESGKGASRSSTLTADGRFVAFVSAANDLVLDDTNGIPDVFVRDVQAGVTRLASVGAMAASSSSSSEAPDITFYGQYVVFYSTATNLVSDAGVSTSGEIYVRDMILDTTYWVSRDAHTLLSSTAPISYNHAISDDGQYVAFAMQTSSGTWGKIGRYNLGSGFTDLVGTNAMVISGRFAEAHNLSISSDGHRVAYVSRNGPTSSLTQIAVWDAMTGATIPANSPDLTCNYPVMDASGRYVFFLGDEISLTSGQPSNDNHLYRRDTLAENPQLLDVFTLPNILSLNSAATIAISSDGRFAAFECYHWFQKRDVIQEIALRDMEAVASELVSVHDPALASQTPNGSCLFSSGGLSADGQLVAFASQADNMVSNDTNSCSDIFVRDLLARTNILVSSATNRVVGDALSMEPAISADGRYVAFTSLAGNLVSRDTNKALDVFVRDLKNGTTALASISADRIFPGNAASYRPMISADGRYVLFLSLANNLAAATPSGRENLHVRDMKEGTTFRLTTNTLTVAIYYYAAMTPDGQYVAFADSATSGKLFVWSSASNRVTRVNSSQITTALAPTLAISPDGRRVVYGVNTLATSGQLYVTDWRANTRNMILPNQLVSMPGLKFSADSRFLVYGALVASSKKVYLYDLTTSSNQLISGSLTNADSPDISADGRFILYRATAADSVPGDDRGLRDVYVYDRNSGTTSILTAGHSGNASLDHRSQNPAFSADGKMIVFQSRASDLVTRDLNQAADLFAFRFIYADIVPGADGAWISWPQVPGSSYTVQYKDALDDPRWQDLGGTITISGDKAYLKDPKSQNAHRFYRIIVN